MAKLPEHDPTPRLDANGHELLDPTPMAIPAGFKRPPTLAEQVRRLVRTSVSEWAANQGYETFEESEDFDVGDSDDPRSPYEENFDPELGRFVTQEEVQRHGDYLRTRRQAELAKAEIKEENQAVESIKKTARRTKKATPKAPDDGPGAPPSTAKGKRGETFHDE